MKTLILNLFAGPGAGKSTACAGIFHELKILGVNCEMALEYAKDRVWDDSAHLLQNQIQLFGEQYHRIWRLLGKVDIVITDAPLLHSILYYEGGNEHFPRMVLEEHQRLNNFNVFLERVKPFIQSGRVHTEEQSRELDLKATRVLDFLGEPYFATPATRSAITIIADMAIRRFKQANAAT
jgi:hypothetical protein